MKQVDIAVVGAGPAGLHAALMGAERGLDVLVIDNADQAGGQLVKQTHKFFGSREQRAGTRGIHIADELTKKLSTYTKARLWLSSTVLSYYPADQTLMIEDDAESIRLIQAQRLIIATGASEKLLPFPGNDLPGVYGAGAVQTLMNVHGVKPGRKVLMVGAGNIGLIVSYQLLQSDVEVVAVVEAAPHIGGYAVHASKIRRMGVPIYTSHSVKAARGEQVLERAVIWQLDEQWNGIDSTQFELPCDVLCLAVGLSPLTELLWQAGCRMVFVPELGGHVPWHNGRGATSVPEVFVAGDAGGVEEASSAMATGALAGLSAVESLGQCPDYAEATGAWSRELDALRAGPAGSKIRKGLQSLQL